ncbi:helix-turn-helix domain containing protein [Sphingobium sp. H39-3-25]|jgi:AcrR family transcriptional regulator|nr:TetR/AcrR family transcriptional regulator [Sphingomonas pollutisoli]MDF0488870.1 helix-turn-helix domain containing protein [Sphingomonas pollutisoli]MDF0546077.1 helix-turn-helix domain containing protein [Sphingobium arseniciresistens]
MVKTPDAIARQQQRAEMRRDQVLDAARACFLREGFHAASVNRIAAEAGMSVGHLYRYFESKEEIIVALCERNLDEFLSHAPVLPPNQRADGEAMIAASLAEFDALIDRSHAGFAMEVLAEAARSEAVQAIVTENDRKFRDSLRDLMVPLLSAKTQDVVEERVEMALLLLHGLMMRTMSGLTSQDVERLKIAFQYLMRAILL